MLFWVVQSVVVVVGLGILLSAVALSFQDGAMWKIASVAVLAILLGLALRLCVYAVPRNHRGFLKFMGWAIPWSVESEGPFLFWPFCELTTHSLVPRAKKDFTLDSNTLNGELIGYMTVQLRLPDPDKDSKDVCKPDGQEVLLYDRRQEGMEEAVKEIAKEIFDELASGMHIQCAVGIAGKKINDLFQIIMRDGFHSEYVEGPRTIKAGEKLNETVKAFYEESFKRMLVRQGITTEPEQPMPLAPLLNDPLDIGIGNILTQQYGAVIQNFTLRIEPSTTAQAALDELGKQQLLRDVERENTDFFVARIGQVKTALPQLSDDQVRQVVLIISKEVAEYKISEFVINGITIDKETVKALSEGFKAAAQIATPKKDKGKGKKS